jgi:quercetin dioxygenase-like cupin family protein
MNTRSILLGSAVLLALSTACGGSEPPPAASPPPKVEAPPPPVAAAPPPPATPAAPAKAEPGDPLDVGPNIYKKVFENQAVRIFEVTFKPGDKIGIHKHPDHVVYVVSPGKLKVTGAEGPAQELDLKQGTAVYLPAQAHSAENIGTTEIKVAVFELRAKGGAPAPKGADPAVVAKKGYKQLLDNERVRVFEVTFAKGAKLPAHTHPEHAAYVVSPGKLKLTDPSKPKAEATQELDLTAGFGGFLPAQVHTAENVGGTEVKLAVVELKPEPGTAAPDAKPDAKPDGKSGAGKPAAPAKKDEKKEPKK